MELLEGKIIAKRLRERIKNMVTTIVDKSDKRPKLVTIFIGNDPASEWYNKSIKKACDNVGIDYELHEYSTIEYKWAVELIKKLNEDEDVSGILINQPLPAGLKDIVELINPEKDIEGITPKNLGNLLLNKETHIPCTPQAVVTIIDDYKINLAGMKVCILGRSNIVGRPLSIMLSHRDSTVTLCHSKTNNLEKELYSADMVIVAIGRAKFVKKDWIKNGAIVIDVGTNYVNDKLVGDVDFDNVKDKASKITPVPGGVGGLTNIILLKNCVEAFIKQANITI